MNILYGYRQLNRITLGLCNKIQGASTKACTNVKINIHTAILKGHQTHVTLIEEQEVGWAERGNGIWRIESCH